MEPTPALVFFVGVLASFIGTVPFGPINLSVIDTTLNRSFRAAMHFSIAAALIEVPQSFIALRFNPIVQEYIVGNPFFRGLTISFFIILGLVFFLRKPQSNDGSAKVRKTSDFVHGLMIAVANPQAIPFWFFVLTFLKTSQHLDLSPHLGLQILLVFLVGVASGKMLALVCYAKMGQLIVAHAHTFNRWMNKIIGMILMGIGFFQIVQGF